MTSEGRTDVRTSHPFRHLMNDYSTYATNFVRCALGLARHIEWVSNNPGVSFDGQTPQRYGFYLTPTQLQRGKDLFTAASALRPELSNDQVLYEEVIPLLHSFLYSLLSAHSEIVNSDSKCCTFMRLMMILIISNDGKFKDCHTFSQPLAGLQWCMRAVLYREIQIRSVELNASIPNLVLASEQVVSEAINSLPAGPYQEIQRWLRVTKVLANRSTGHLSAIWGRVDNVLNYDGYNIPITKMGAMYGGLTKNVEDVLYRDILFGKNIPFKLPSTVHDDFNCTTEGHSWVKNKGNQTWLKEFGDDYFLMKVIAEDVELTKAMVSPSGYPTAKARKWYMQLKEWKVEVGILLKLACGGSLRDSEQMQLLLCESPGRRRSFFFVGNEMVMCPEYGKMETLQGDSKPNPRAVYDRLRDVLALYMVVIYPYEVYIRGLLADDKNFYYTTRFMMFADEKAVYDDKIFSKRIAELTEIWLGVRFTSSDLRQITAAILEHSVPSELTTMGYANFAQRALGHTESIAQRYYKSTMFLGTLSTQEAYQLLAVSDFFILKVQI